MLVVQTRCLRVYASVSFEHSRLKTVIAQRNHGGACTTLYEGGSPTDTAQRSVETLSIDRGNAFDGVGGVYKLS